MYYYYYYYYYYYCAGCCCSSVHRHLIKGQMWEARGHLTHCHVRLGVCQPNGSKSAQSAPC